MNPAKEPITNVHVHIFNSQYVPDKFTSMFIGLFPKLITRLLKKKWSAKMIIGILNLLPKKNANRKMAAFLKVGIEESQYRIFHKLKNNEGYSPGTRFVVLPINFEHMGAGRVKVPYKQQLADLIRVKASAPGTLLPFLFVDPRMGTAEYNLNFVKYYVKKKGFVGLKLYPAIGYYPYDPRLELVYKYAEDKGLPIMTHCSSTGIFYNDRKNIPQEFINAESFNHQEIHPITGEPRKYHFPFPPKDVKKKKYMERFADNFLDPINYTDILDRYPEIKICFAHFGLDNEQKEGKIKLSWHEDIKWLMEKYENVYADISYSLHYEDYRQDFTAYMQDSKISKKILYGTDFFMTLMEVDTERELYMLTQQSFGTDFRKIARDNVIHYLNSKYYTY